MGLVALMLVAFAYQLTGNLIHEIAGISMLLLLLAHNLVNRKWYKVVFKGRYNGRRILNATLTVLLIVDLIILTVSGIMISSDLFAFLQINAGLGVRQIHTACAYWLLVIGSFHLGMHWNFVSGIFRRIFGISGVSRMRTYVLRLLAVMVAAYGLKTSWDMGIHYKLISHYTFDFWDFENETAGFFAAYISIMGFFAFIAYYCAKFIFLRKST